MTDKPTYGEIPDAKPGDPGVPFLNLLREGPRDPTHESEEAAIRYRVADVEHAYQADQMLYTLHVHSPVTGDSFFTQGVRPADHTDAALNAVLKVQGSQGLTGLIRERDELREALREMREVARYGGPNYGYRRAMERAARLLGDEEQSHEPS